MKDDEGGKGTSGCGSGRRDGERSKKEGWRKRRRKRSERKGGEAG